MNNRTATNNRIRGTSRSRIFNLLYRKDSLSKRDFQIQLGLSLPTITQSLSSLLDEGLIYINGQIGNTGGRKAATFSVADDAKYAIGLDITRHHITAVVINLHGQVIAQLRIRYSFKRTDTYLRELGKIVDRIIIENHIDTSRVLGVGI